MTLPGPGETVDEPCEQAPCAGLSTSQDGTVTRVNQTFLDLTGQAREALLGRCRMRHLMTGPGWRVFETHARLRLCLQGQVKAIACNLQRPNACSDRWPARRWAAHRRR